MNLTEVVKPITYLKNHTAEVVRDAAESGQLFVVTQNGEAKAVVMGVAQYTDWRRALALLKLLAQGEADIASHRVVSQTEAFRRAERSLSQALGDAQTILPSAVDRDRYSRPGRSHRLHRQRRPD